MALILEVCVDSSAGLKAAVAGGADRIELCSALSLGGLTPSIGFMAEAAACGLPVIAMIRPRAGGFVFTEAEITQMEVDIAAARATGLAGAVVGASLADGRLDMDCLTRLAAAAEGMELTLHRAFDLVPDPFEALDQALTLPFSRILTSGGAVTAEAGLDRLRQLIAAAGDRIVILPGSGISASNAAFFVEIGARELHASCSKSQTASGPEVSLGFAPEIQKSTDAALVRALKLALR